MTTVISIKKGDTLPQIKRTLEYSNGSPVDLTGASIYFNMGNLIDHSAYSSGVCVITGSTTGECTYNWNAVDTSTPGTYWGEFEVNWGNGSVMTLPSNDNIKIKVYEDYN